MLQHYKDYLQEGHPVHRNEEVNCGKERVPGRLKQCLKVGQGRHLCIQRLLAFPSQDYLIPCWSHQNFSLPCQDPVTIEIRARRSSKDANTELPPKSGEEGERSEKRGKEIGVKRKKTNLHRAESTAHVSRGARQVIIIKLGPNQGEKAPHMVGDRTMRPIPL